MIKPIFQLKHEIIAGDLVLLHFLQQKLPLYVWENGREKMQGWDKSALGLAKRTLDMSIFLKWEYPPVSITKIDVLFGNTSPSGTSRSQGFRDNQILYGLCLEGEHPNILGEPLIGYEMLLRNPLLPH